MARRTPRLRTLQPRIGVLDTRTARPPAKVVDPVYHSPEYQAWRQVVLGRANGCCQDPGHKGPNPWLGQLYPDHIREVKDGGAPFDPDNGMARCAPCHTRKSNVERAKRHAIAAA